MKTIKALLLLIILGLLGTLIYQNLDYFMTPSALHIDLKIASWQWTAQELPNIAYWGICFGLGLFLTGLKGMFTGFRLGKEIRTKDKEILNLKKELNNLKKELDVFTHDPYIKNQKNVLKEISSGDLETSEAAPSPAPQQPHDEKASEK